MEDLYSFMKVVKILAPALFLLLAGFVLGLLYQAKRTIQYPGTGESLFYYLPPFEWPHSDEAKEAARYILQYLESGDTTPLARALDLYSDLLTREKFGSEFTALQWFCNYSLAPPEEKKRYLQNRDGRRFLRYFAADNHYFLKLFLKLRYELFSIHDDLTREFVFLPGEHKKTKILDVTDFLEEMIAFNSPGREEWERTGRILEIMDLKKGDRIADIGSGSGYYTFRFSDIVGETGKVYAIEVDEHHLNYVKLIIEEENFKNVHPILSCPTNIMLEKDSVDHAFMCSLYHFIYGGTERKERTLFIESIRKALRKGGRLVIVDNNVEVRDAPPYWGVRIAKQLTVEQLRYYGFRLVGEYQIIPQRYVLIFEEV